MTQPNNILGAFAKQRPVPWSQSSGGGTVETPQPTEPRTVAVTTESDMNLTVTGPGLHKVTFRVASQVLRIASSVFRAMLGPGSQFKEARDLERSMEDGETYNLFLEDDDVKSMEKLLYAIHLHEMAMVPLNTFKSVVDLAVVCEKYDLYGAVRPWIEGWIGPWRSYVLSDGYEGWLYVAWVFRDADSFKRLSKNLILESTAVTMNIYLWGIAFDSNLPQTVTGKLI